MPPSERLCGSALRSMPLSLSHEALLKCAVLQISNEISVAPLSLLTRLGSSTSSSPCTSWVLTARSTLRWWWVICRAGLESDGLSRVEMASHSLDCNRYAALLHFHCGSSLTTRPHRSLLCIETLLTLLLLRMLWWTLCVLRSHLRRTL